MRIADIIGQSGIDTEIFKVRSPPAATSKASSIGIFLTEIITWGQ